LSSSSGKGGEGKALLAEFLGHKRSPTKEKIRSYKTLEEQKEEEEICCREITPHPPQKSIQVYAARGWIARKKKSLARWTQKATCQEKEGGGGGTLRGTKRDIELAEVERISQMNGVDKKTSIRILHQVVQNSLL